MRGWKVDLIKDNTTDEEEKQIKSRVYQKYDGEYIYNLNDYKEEENERNEKYHT